MKKTYDLAIVGAGIAGLAHALAAARLGKSVVVIDRDAQANGASIRNFGFITVTGQERGECWNRAMRSRDVWAEVAPQAGIAIEHRGLVVAVRRQTAKAVTARVSSLAGPSSPCRIGLESSTYQSQTTPQMNS